MKTYLIVMFILYSIFSFGQDFDVYQRKQDDKVTIPNLHESLQLDEFQLLSRDARMMDMFYAVAVPGYVHFKAKEPAKAYALIGIRAVSYVGMLSSYYSGEGRINRTLGLSENEDTIEIFNGYSVNKYDFIFTMSLLTAISTYLYDWIHGKMILERKQEHIRYKYGMKFKLEQYRTGINSSSITPGIGISLTF